nr:hypothetical protein [Tanacetum cinerariifolium]
MDCWDVISKLKDDGDFDKLRLKLIRKLKHNEELRDNIVSIVRQSVAINRPGAENMKPRQLSDAIHEEVGSKLNEQISDVLWEIIRSPDGMKREITETVKAVCHKLSRTKRDDDAESSGGDQKRTRKEYDYHKSNVASTIEVDDISDNELKEPPGFSHTDELQKPIPVHTLPAEEQQKETLHQIQEVSPNDPSGAEHKVQGDDSDDDLDAPPGFG